MLCSLSGYAYEHSGSLPVIYINTEKEIVDKAQGYVNASYWLENNGCPVEALGSEAEPLPLEVKARGNYTWIAFDKKPYKLKLGKKTKLMGMEKNKHFALLAHADDPTGFSRNMAGFELSRRLGLAWTPADKPLEVYLNGDYRGLYFLTETIRVDDTRVNISEQNDLSDESVDGGWLVEIDNYDTDPHITVNEKESNYPIWFTYKSPEELTPGQEAYLQAQMEAINEAIFDSDKTSTRWQELIDIESAVRFYIVQEIVDNYESYHGSCYLYKDKGEESKWHFGPVWDFGNAFNRDDGHKDKFVWEEPRFHQVWIGELYKFPAFQDKIKEVWKDFRDNGYPGFEEYMLDYAEAILPAQDANFQRWPQYGNSNIKDMIETTIENVRESMQWLDNKWGDNKTEPDVPGPGTGDEQPERDIVYLRGTLNDWDTSLKMTELPDGMYEISMSDIADRGYEFSSGGQFKVATEDWYTVDLGAPDANMTPVLGIPFPLIFRGANIIVPDGLTDSYKLILNVKDSFLTFVEVSGVNDITVDDETPEIYTVTGQRVDQMTHKGVYILRYSDHSEKIVK